MLYVHKHKDTFPWDDECRCTQYDDEGVHEAHDTRWYGNQPKGKYGTDYLDDQDQE